MNNQSYHERNLVELRGLRVKREEWRQKELDWIDERRQTRNDHINEVRELKKRISTLESEKIEIEKKCTRLEGKLEIYEQQSGHHHEVNLAREQYNFWLFKGGLKSKEKTRAYTTSFGRELFS